MSTPIPARGLAEVHDRPHDDTLTLSHDRRHLRRAVLTSDAGLAILVDLPRAVVLSDGDRLVLDDGRHVAICAAAEPVVAITARDSHHLTRLAWHLGNRHLPTQIAADRLVIRRDHVIEAMLERLGATLTPMVAPFVPEGGAYGHGATHGHEHGHEHRHGHSHGHDHHHHHHGHD